MDFITMLARLVIAGLLGSIIGLEREKLHKPAGIRTDTIVAVACAMLVIAAQDIFINPESVGRIIAGILTGIGFLGAGTIFKTPNAVHGLTTGASVWVVAAIGIVVGLGHYVLAITTFVLVMATLLLINRPK